MFGNDSNDQHYPRPYMRENIHGKVHLRDYGGEPFVINIHEAAKQNDTFRTAIWTGEDMQLTLMSLNVGEDIGLEVHPEVEQFIRVEQGRGIVQMGPAPNQLNFVREINDDTVMIIPAGMWHNVINTGRSPLKLYTIYAPPEHPFGTVHKTKKEALEAEAELEMMSPEAWLTYTNLLLEKAIEDVEGGRDVMNVMNKIMLMGILVGKGYTPEEAYETVKSWEETGEVNYYSDDAS